MSTINAKPSAPRKYSGTRDMVELDNWVFAVEQYLELVSIEETKKVALLSTFLVGEALLWFRSEFQGLTLAQRAALNWNEVLLLLKNYFRPPNMQDTLMDQWVSLRQTSSVSNYVAALRALQLQLPALTREQVLDKFVRGLRPRTKIEIKLRAPQTIDEAISLADRYDRIVYGYNDSTHLDTSMGASPYQTDPDAMQIDAVQIQGNTRRPQRPQQRPMNQKPQIQTGPIRDMTRVTCYNCNKTGHYAKDCRSPRRNMGPRHYYGMQGKERAQ